MNKPDKRDGSTPLIIATKRNFKNVVNFLLDNGADASHRNNLNLNALDYAVIYGAYEIAYGMKNKFPEIKLKTLDEYIDFNRTHKLPCFNIPLFYSTLYENVDPKNTPQMHLTNEEKNKFEGKIPDPDETWANFFKRVMKFELYQPPLVDKASVPCEKKYTMFVKMQAKLLEMEFDQKSIF